MNSCNDTFFADGTVLVDKMKDADKLYNMKD